MADTSPRLGMAIPEGSTGDDDFVLVKEHVSDNLLLLEGGLGFYHVANFAALPVTGNFKGRLAWVDDVGTIYRYNGSVWVVHKDVLWQAHTPGPITAAGGNVTLGNSVQTGSYKRNEQDCTYRYTFTVGNTGFSGSTGEWGFTLPFPALVDSTDGGGWLEISGLGYFSLQPRTFVSTFMQLFTNLDTDSSKIAAIRNAIHPAGGVGTGTPIYPGDYPFQSSRPNSFINATVTYRYRA